MSQSLYTAMGGISAAQTALNVVSNNIANLNTTGFKSSSVNFADVFYTTTSSGTGATNSTGGTNPMQVGLGVKVGSVAKNFSSGTWVATGQTTDLMVQGQGFFSVKSSAGEVFYTRAGNFSFDSDGDLVSSDGFKVLGTDKLLSSASSSTAVHIPQRIITDVGANSGAWSQPISKLNNCSLTNGDFYITVKNNAGTTGTPIKITIDTSKTGCSTMGGLAEDIQAQLTTAGVTGVDVACDASTGGTVQFKMTDQVTNTAAASLTFTNATTNQTNFMAKTGITSAVLTNHTYTSDVLDYKVDVSQVTSISDAVSISSYSIGDDGSIEATYSNGDTMSVKVGTDGNTYEFVYKTAANIIIEGSDVNVDPNLSVPSNFVIQLASVINTDGLLAAGSNMFRAGPNTGDIIYSVGNAMGLGSIASGGLEASNVDLSSEFSAMILAQRAVQANSRVFSTTSTIMDSIVNMGR